MTTGLVFQAFGYGVCLKLSGGRAAQRSVI